MSNKKLIILGIITACMIAWAIVQARVSNKPKAAPEIPTYLIQGVDPTNIDSIIVGTGDDQVTLKRNGKHFVVTNMDNYPAEMTDINNLIASCLDIKTEEFVTDNPSNHKDLGVTEEDAEYVVKFFKHGSDLMVGVIVGKGKSLGHGTYVRLIPGNKVYVTSGRPWIKDQALNYVNRNIISVNRSDIASVTVSSSGETYTLKTEGNSDDIILENLQPGKALKKNESENVFTALKNLRFEDVMRLPASGEQFVFNRKFICRLKNSTVYNIDIARKDDKTYIKCEAEFTDKTPVTKEQGVVESEEELRKKEAKLLAKDKAEAFSARHGNWVYEIAGYDAGNMVKKLSELYEDENKEETKEGQKSE